MPTANAYKRAQEFISKNEAGYLKLLHSVKTTAEAVQHQHPSRVKTVYSRGDKQPNGEELKTADKLPRKLMGLRDKAEKAAKLASATVKQLTWLDIPDIIGITVVVHYPDQIIPTLNDILAALKAQNITLVGQIEKKSDFGYYAHHATVLSNDLASQRLLCEIQCKSMLHDAWATKMHDLTYKPTGVLDAKHQSIMEIFGDTLERFEQQSQLVRDLIIERWQAGQQRRRLAYATLLDGSSVFMEEEGSSATARKVSAEISAEKEHLKACPLSDTRLNQISSEIDSQSDRNPFEAVVLAARLTANRGTPDLSAYLYGHMERCLEETRRSADQAVPTRNLVIIPLAFSAAGSLDMAIDYSREMLSDDIASKLVSKGKWILKMNLAHFIVERQCYEPNKDARRVAADRSEVEALSAEIESDQMDCGDLDVQSAIDDLRGFTLIALSDDAASVRKGIEQCSQAQRTVLAKGRTVDAQHCEAHIRKGWQRLLELEKD